MSQYTTTRVARLLLTILVACGPAVLARGADFYAGKDVYAMHCQGCHGETGSSNEPGTPDFSRGESLYAQDSDLLRKIRAGGGAMPAYRGILKDDDILNVIAYLRSLQR